MLNVKLQDALNKQINAEFFSAYMYLSMSAHFSAVNLNGMAGWMREQAREELTHATKMYDYVHARGGTVTLTTIEAPQQKWNSPLDVFQHAYGHEQQVTAMINNLVDLAIVEKDHASHNMLQWYISEQVEEEETFSEVLEKIRMVNNDASGLLMINKEMALRQFTPPAK